MVEKPQELGIDDLIRKMPLEERLYRHRCVEAWSMAIPWSGFPFAKLVGAGQAAVVGEVRTDGNLPRSRESRPAKKQTWYPWPYVEGLTIAEKRPTTPSHSWSPAPMASRLSKVQGRAAAARGAVEIRLQVDQVDRTLQLHRSAPEELLGRIAGG